MLVGGAFGCARFDHVDLKAAVLSLQDLASDAVRGRVRFSRHIQPHALDQVDIGLGNVLALVDGGVIERSAAL